MKYIYTLLLLLIILSCGSDTSPDNSIKTIKFWHFWSEPNQKMVLDSLLREFTNQTGIKVETTQLSWNDGKTKLFTSFNSGEGPDVLELGSDWVAQFSSNGALSEMNDSLKEFLEWSTAPCYWEGKVFAKPWIVDSRVIFYNMEMLNKYGFDKPAKSFQEMFTQCLKIGGKIGSEVGFGNNGPDPNRLYKKALIFIWSSGGDVIKDGQCVLEDNLVYRAVDFYDKMCLTGIIDKQKRLDEVFVSGQMTYTISGGWLIDKIERENPELNYGVMTIPEWRGNQGISFAGGEYLSINNKSVNKEESKMLIDFLTNGKNAIEFCKKVVEAGFPADKDYYNDPFYDDKPNRKIIAEQLKSARMSPVHPRWLEMQDEIEKAFETVIFKHTPADTAINRASRVIKSILNNTN